VLDQPVAEALGVRAQERPRLTELGISSIRSAIEYWPRDHYDYSQPVRINRMVPEMVTTLIGTLVSAEMRQTPNRNLKIVEAKVQDPTGRMSVSWFNQPYRLKELKAHVGQEVAISGKVEQFKGGLQLAPRDVEFPADDEEGTNTRRVVPVYPASDGSAGSSPAPWPRGSGRSPTRSPTRYGGSSHSRSGGPPSSNTISPTPWKAGIPPATAWRSTSCC